MKKYAIPRQTDERMNSTNGFTIGMRYPLLWQNDHVARVSNDNGHERVIPLDGGSNGHLQYRRGKGYDERCSCAGYFEIREVAS